MSEKIEYRFVGPDQVRKRTIENAVRWKIASASDIALVALALAPRQTGFSATYVILVDATLWVASLRSEHYACAQGGGVLAAGEISFSSQRGVWRVTEINNRSTGYCPEPSCWTVVERTLRLAGIPHPDGFTDVFEFRRCTACGNINLIKDCCFVCACGIDLPLHWNFAVPNSGPAGTV